jgi:hypothetical protein
VLRKEELVEEVADRRGRKQREDIAKGPSNNSLQDVSLLKSVVP